MLITSQRVRKTTAYLKEVFGQDIQLFTASEMGVLTAAPPGLRILVANTSELDYPFDFLPLHVIPCGPIIRASPHIRSIDPSLGDWLARGPTLYVNLGSHLEMSPSEALEMASAFRILLDSTSGSAVSHLQILWKIKWKDAQRKSTATESVPADPLSSIYKVLEKEQNMDRIRITEWITAEPKSILESNHVICSVNHGGASSFNEALW